MTQLNYGISCEDDKKALKLYKHISKINIIQDGLDVSDERVSVISSQHLVSEIEKFSAKNEGFLRVEIWSAEKEYDDAETDGSLEIHEFEGKKTSKAEKSPKLTKFKSYSGQSAMILEFKNWLKSQSPDGLEILSEWVPEVEFGSYGIEFQCGDSKFDKAAYKEWMPKGVIIEKLK